MAPSSSAASVFTTNELLTLIMSYLEERDLIAFQRISKAFKFAFESSSRLQQLAMLAPTNTHAPKMRSRRLQNPILAQICQQGRRVNIAGSALSGPHWYIDHYYILPENQLWIDSPPQLMLQLRRIGTSGPGKEILLPAGSSWRRAYLADPGCTVWIDVEIHPGCYVSGDMRDGLTLGSLAEWLERRVRGRAVFEEVMEDPQDFHLSAFCCVTEDRNYEYYE